MPGFATRFAARVTTNRTAQRCTGVAMNHTARPKRLVYVIALEKMHASSRAAKTNVALMPYRDRR